VLFAPFALAGCVQLHDDTPELREAPEVVPPAVVPPPVAPIRSDAGRPDSGSRPPRPDAATDASRPDAATDAALADAATDAVLITPERNLRVAFLGDEGLGAAAVAVLELIADEGAAAIVHAGDLDYTGDPEAWDAQIDGVLGASFPYFVAIGNHDVAAWETKGGYREVLLARLARIDGASCDGDYGVNALCHFRGVAFALSGVGTYGEDHEAFLDAALSDRSELWRLCVWHKNQHDMQLGGKTDEVGWDAYQTCAAHGAPVITGHEHSYARTRSLLAIGSREAAHGAAFGPFEIALEPGRTMVVVTGLGGASARGITEEHGADTWWASIYARGLQIENGVIVDTATHIDFGALFIDFHVDGDPHRARGYFKTVNGEVVDEFELTMR
jgi:hypothetical protein